MGAALGISVSTVGEWVNDGQTRHNNALNIA
jgi:hypothetical protein